MSISVCTSGFHTDDFPRTTERQNEFLYGRRQNLTRKPHAHNPDNGTRHTDTVTTLPETRQDEMKKKRVQPLKVRHLAATKHRIDRMSTQQKKTENTKKSTEKATRQCRATKNTSRYRITL